MKKFFVYNISTSNRPNTPQLVAGVLGRFDVHSSPVLQCVSYKPSRSRVERCNRPVLPDDGWRVRQRPGRCYPASPESGNRQAGFPGSSLRAHLLRKLRDRAAGTGRSRQSMLSLVSPDSGLMLRTAVNVASSFLAFSRLATIIFPTVSST